MIIVALVALQPLFHGDDQIYAYAIGVLLGTIVQFAHVLPGARAGSASACTSRFDWRDPRVIRRCSMLMLPVTLGLGRHQLRPR